MADPAVAGEVGAVAEGTAMDRDGLVGTVVTDVVAGVVSHRRTLIGLLVVAPTMLAGLRLVWVSGFEDALKVFMALMIPTGTVIGYLFGRQSGQNGGQEVD